MPELEGLIVPLLIFVARILDVSIGTVRMIMVIAGHRIVSAALGFIEVLIWALAAGGVVKHLDNPLALLAFAGGFATGTLIGMAVEQRLAIGYRVVRVINPKPGIDLAGAIRSKGFVATRIDGRGRDGPVEIVFLTVRRRVVRELLDAVGEITPEAFVSVERAEKVTGFTPIIGVKNDRFPWGRFGQLRK